MKGRTVSLGGLLLLLGMMLLLAFPTFSGADELPYAGGDGNGRNCCDMCICTRSIPPQCRCTDVKNDCPANCNACLCTKSWPPQCRCRDITDSCALPCTPRPSIIDH